ncbi:YlbG family protein [Fructilactobacillus frigidiflavus]|uniref:YlbG family protein n=1 Tax=Fructilactobacillus frigidiflavus TaxID=3242688 RepID=UPI003757753E
METIQARTELLVSIFSLKQAKNLKKFGDVRFISKKMHYVILFVDCEQIEATIEEIKKQRYVKRVEKTPTIALAKELNELNLNAMEEE